MASKSAQPAKEESPEELLEIAEQACDRLRVMYEQYFLGMQKQAPGQLHTEVERRTRDLQQANLRNTALRYRFATLQQKFASYNAYWKRTLRQIENGTYVRNLHKIGRNAVMTGAEVPEEILAAMPKRMREQVQRDRAAAIARAERRGGSGKGEAAAAHDDGSEDVDLLDLGDAFTADPNEAPMELPPEELADVVAMIKEPSELRRKIQAQRGPHRINENDGDLDIDSFFAAVEAEGPAAAQPSRRANDTSNINFRAMTRSTIPPAMQQMPQAPDFEPEVPLPQQTSPARRPSQQMTAQTSPQQRPSQPMQAQTSPSQRPSQPLAAQVSPSPRSSRPSQQMTAQTSPQERPSQQLAAQTSPQERPSQQMPAQAPPRPVQPPPLASQVSPSPFKQTGGLPPLSRPQTMQTPSMPMPVVPAPPSGQRKVPTIPPPIPPTIPRPAPSQAVKPNPIAPGSAATARLPVPVPTQPLPRTPNPVAPPVASPPRRHARADTEPEPVRGAPVRPSTPARPPAGMTDADVNALYAKYVKAKEMVGEAAGPGAYGKLLKTINAQAPKIMEQYKAKGVDFQVVVKDNQVIIRAKPKP